MSDGIVIQAGGTQTITGGSINNTPIGNTTPSTGTFTTATATRFLGANGSNTLPSFSFINDGSTGRSLNAAGDMRESVTGAYVAQWTTSGLNACAIGASTPSTGAFTTGAFSGTLNSSNTTAGTGTAGVGAITTAGGIYSEKSIWVGNASKVIVPNGNGSFAFGTTGPTISQASSVVMFSDSTGATRVGITAATVTFTGLTDTNKQIAGGTGAVTQNSATGQVQFAAAATSLVVTNSQCTANSLVKGFLAGVDSTAVLNNAVAAAGSFTLNMKVAPTATVKVNWEITN